MWNEEHISNYNSKPRAMKEKQTTRFSTETSTFKTFAQGYHREVGGSATQKTK